MNNTGKPDTLHFRHEYKYMIDAVKEMQINIHAEGLLEADTHTDADGEYIVRSLYFDSIDRQSFYENEAGTDPRSKFRIRIYNCNTDRIVLEKKSKVRGMCSKESCPISIEQCRMFMEGGFPPPDNAVSPKQGKLFAEMMMRGLFPAVIVQYLRRPYIYEAGNVRITFDSCICSSGDYGGFLEENIILRPVLPAGNSILEVKWDAFLPAVIKDCLRLDSLQWISFSKYYLCAKYNCYGGLMI